MNHSNKMTPLHIATIENNMEMVQLLLNSDCERNIQILEDPYFDHILTNCRSSHLGMTALHISIHNDNFKLLELLIESGCDINSTNKSNIVISKMKHLYMLLYYYIS